MWTWRWDFQDPSIFCSSLPSPALLEAVICLRYSPYSDKYVQVASTCSLVPLPFIGPSLEAHKRDNLRHSFAACWAPGQWSRSPCDWAAPGVPRSGPIVPPLAMGSCLWASAGGSPAPGSAIPSCSGKNPILWALTHWGPPSRGHLWLGQAGHRDPQRRPGPSCQPSAKCFPSANKGKTLLLPLLHPPLKAKGGVT